MSARYSSHSTSAVEATGSFEYWRHLISDTFVPLTAEPAGTWHGEGHIGHARYPGLDVSTVRAPGQHVRRTPTLIARSDAAYVLASIQIAGTGMVEQDGRQAPLRPGDVAFYDSTRPYSLHFDDAFEQIVVQMPLAEAASLSGVRRVETATARTLPATGAAGAVSAFFRAFAAAQRTDPDGADAFAATAGMLLATALAAAGGRGAPVEACDALRHRQAVDVVHRRLHEATLCADVVAADLHVSRRTLYRTFEPEPGGFSGLVRRLRVERARHLLRTCPTRPVSSVAAACGFAGEVQFHRVFKQATGTTPAQHRADGTPG